MVDGVTICMNNRTSLSTVALLSTLWEKEQRDYLDVIGQFVLRCMPQEIDAKVDIATITAKMRADYGFDDIPYQVVEKVLRRLSKLNARPKRYFRRENRCFYVMETFDGRSFDLAQQETNALIRDVLEALIDYLEGNHLHKRINTDEATEYLFHFFDAYGMTVVHDSSLLRAITTASGNSNFFVARFILENYEKRTPVFDKLLRITTGFLIHKAVYFYSAEMKSSYSSKLRDVTFYLDCSLVIDALGYDSVNDETAYDEMSQLVRTNGGRLSVFRHTVEEASRVLEAYAHKPQSHNSFTLAGLDARGYPSEVLASIATPQAIEDNLRQKGILVCDTPSYDPTRIVDGKNLYEGFENEVAIEQQLLKYSYKKNGILNGDRLSYDAKTLSAIGRLRRGRRPSSIETCHAMVITQGSILNRCMRELYPDRFPGEIDFAINDLDLVSLLWLGQRNKESQLPQNLLIANAVAACQITQDIMDQAIELAYRMEQDKAIPSEAALIIRSQSVIRSMLFDETRNNPSQLNENTIKKIISDFVARESRDDAEAAIEKAVDENAAKLRAQHAQDMVRIKKELDQVYAVQRQQAVSMRTDAERIAKKWACRAGKAVRITVLAIWLLCLAGSVYCWWRGGFVYTNFSAIILSVLSLLQIVDYLFKVFDLKERFSGWAHDKVFAAMYSREIHKREVLSHIPLHL